MTTFPWFDVDGFQSDLERITDEHAGVLECQTCGTRGPVEARYWREGWPRCCGYTMRWITARQLREGT